MAEDRFISSCIATSTRLAADAMGSVCALDSTSFVTSDIFLASNETEKSTPASTYTYPVHLPSLHLSAASSDQDQGLSQCQVTGTSSHDLMFSDLRGLNRITCCRLFLHCSCSRRRWRRGGRLFDSDQATLGCVR